MYHNPSTLSYITALFLEGAISYTCMVSSMSLLSFLKEIMPDIECAPRSNQSLGIVCTCPTNTNVIYQFSIDESGYVFMQIIKNNILSGGETLSEEWYGHWTIDHRPPWREGCGGDS